MYEEAGEAAGILRGHLNRVLSRSLPTRQERELAVALARVQRDPPDFTPEEKARYGLEQ